MLRTSDITAGQTTTRSRPSAAGRSLRATIAGTLLRVSALLAPTSGLQEPAGISMMTAALRPVAGQAAPARAAFDPRFLDARPALGSEAQRSWTGVPLSSAWEAATGPILASVDVAAELPPQAIASQPGIQAESLPGAMPLPPMRPAELRAPSAPSRVAARRSPRGSRTAQAAQPDNRSFLDRLFGVQPAPGPALAYAALQSGPVEAPPPVRLSPVPAPAAGAGVAVYDISARTVTLPNGERLEAHSGLGPRLDDPRYVHVRMHGATPPGTYDLTEREALFHGVRALRLNPVGGSAAVHGRAGLLTHTFMLGPNGDSNGCVSFRDYQRFLQAYLRGEVRRLVVVAGSGQDGVPGLVNRLFGTRSHTPPPDRNS